MKGRSWFPALVGLAVACVGVVTTGGLMSCAPEFTMHHKKLKSDERDRNLESLARLSGSTPLTRLQGEGGSISFKIGVLSDTHNDYDDLEKTVRLLNARTDLDFILVTGDITNVGMIWEYRQTLALLKKIRVPVVTLMGNHDALTIGKDIYRDMFGPFEFTFTHKGVRFVVWNSSKLEFNKPRQDFSYLKREIQRAAPAGEVRRTVAVTHIPPMEPEKVIFSQSEKDELHGLLRAHGISLSLHGHLHYHSIKKRDDVRYVTFKRVRAVHYSVVAFSGESQTISLCTASGCEVKQDEKY